MKRKLLGGGMLGIKIPGELMLATVSVAGKGHSAEPLSTAQLIEEHVRPGDGVSLNTAFAKLDGPVLVKVMT
jgi:hypothetical protein